jgi:hypothetical protein
MDLYFERHDGQAATIEDFPDGVRGRVRGATWRSSRSGITRPERRTSSVSVNA